MIVVMKENYTSEDINQVVNYIENKEQWNVLYTTLQVIEGIVFSYTIGQKLLGCPMN